MKPHVTPDSTRVTQSDRHDDPLNSASDKLMLNDSPQPKRLATWLGYITGLAIVALSLYLMLAPVAPDSSSRTDTTAQPGGQTPIVPTSLDASPEQAAFPDRPELSLRNIEDIRVGDRVEGHNPQVTDAERAAFPEIVPADWRQLELVLPKDDGSLLEITLLRPASWVESFDIPAEPGEFPLFVVPADEDSGKIDSVFGIAIPLNMPELGAVGNAFLLEISSAPDSKPGSGQVVTGTFAHHAPSVLDLTITGVDAPIGVTPNHPFWSEDRQDFVEAEGLEPGELVRTLDGFAQVVSIIARAGPEAVFNIEVHGEHVYHVSSAGVLVHNQYAAEPEVHLFVKRFKETYPGRKFESGHARAHSDGRLLEIDFETDNVIIEFKANRGGGLGRQITDRLDTSINPHGKVIIGVAGSKKGLSRFTRAEIESRGGLAGQLKEIEDILSVIKPD